jgi:hypothetical protein
LTDIVFFLFFVMWKNHSASHWVLIGVFSNGMSVSADQQRRRGNGHACPVLHESPLVLTGPLWVNCEPVVTANQTMYATGSRDRLVKF